MDSEAPAAPKKKSCCKVLIKYLFSHIGLFILVCLYGVLGAYGFTQLESPLEEQKFHTKQVKTREAEQAVQYLTSKLYLLRSMNNMTEEEWKRKDPGVCGASERKQVLYAGEDSTNKLVREKGIAWRGKCNYRYQQPVLLRSFHSLDTLLCRYARRCSTESWDSI